MNRFDKIINKIEADIAVLNLRDDITAKKAFLMAEAIEYYSERGYKVKLNVNTSGGVLMPTLSLINAIETYEVDTHNEGVSASAGALIVASGKHRTMNDFGLVMFHGAQTTKDKTDKIKNVVGKFNESLKTIIASRTKFSENEIDEIINGERWLDASESLEMGVIDEVVSTGSEVMEVSNDIKSLVNKAKQINNKMSDANQMQDLLLKKDETISDLNNKYKSLHESKEALDADLKNKDSKIEELEAKILEAERKEAEAIINSKNIELDEAGLSFWVTNYMNDKESTLKALEGMKVANKVPEGASISDALKNQKEVSDTDYWESNEGQKALADLKNDASTADFALEVQKSITKKYLK